MAPGDRFCQVERDGTIVHDLRPRDLVYRPGPFEGRLMFLKVIKGESHVLDGQRHAIVPGDTWMQRECPRGPVFGYVPAIGQPRDHPLLVLPGQRIEEERHPYVPGAPGVEGKWGGIPPIFPGQGKHGGLRSGGQRATGRGIRCRRRRRPRSIRRTGGHRGRRTPRQQANHHQNQDKTTNSFPRVDCHFVTPFVIDASRPVGKSVLTDRARKRRHTRRSRALKQGMQ